MLFVILTILSCEKMELPVKAHTTGSSTTNQVAMGQDYRNQLFFDLETNQIVSTNLKTEWDLGFESSGTNNVILNTSKGMAIHKSDSTFENITSTAGLDWSWDAHSGNLDSTAFGEWETEQKLYIIDLGYDHLGGHQGYKKLLISSADVSGYSIQYGDITAMLPLSQVIFRDIDNVFSFFSFSTGSVSIAPPNIDWDIEFTQYTHLFTGPLTPYVVSGVLLNRFETLAGLITNIPYDDVTFDDAEAVQLTNTINTIGYAWKAFDFGTGLYAVNPDLIYILQTSEGFYYKLHFIDFYNSLGEKGHPTFEFQQL